MTGDTVTDITLLGGFFESFCQAPSGVIWAGGEGGLFSGTAGAWTQRFDAGSQPGYSTWSLAGSSENDIWVAGTFSTAFGLTSRLWRWNGSALITVDAGLPLLPRQAFGLQDAVFSRAGRNQLVRFDGASFNALPWTGFDSDPTHLDGTASDDVWALAADGVWHFDGTGWRYARTAGGGLMTYAWDLESRGVAWVWGKDTGAQVLYRCTPGSCAPYLRTTQGEAGHRLSSRAGVTYLSFSRYNPTAPVFEPFRRVADGGFAPLPTLAGYRDPIALADGGLLAFDRSTGEVHELRAAGWNQLKPPGPSGSSSLTVDTAGKPVVATCSSGTGCDHSVWNGVAFADAGRWPGREFSGAFPSDMWMLGRAPQLLRGTDAGLAVHEVRGVSPWGIYASGGHVFLVVKGGILHRRP